MKNEKTAATPAAKPAAETTDKPMLTAPQLAKRLNLKPTHLRRILRSMVTYNDGIHTKYGWDESTQAGRDAVKAIATEVARRKGGPATDKAVEAKNATKAA